MENVIKNQIETHQKIGLFLGPILAITLSFFPLPEGLSPQAYKVASIGILMAVWWATEAKNTYGACEKLYFGRCSCQI